MRKAGTVLLVVALAGAAFFLGTRYRPAATAPVATQAERAASVAREKENSARPEAQPPQTFRGPDGRPHLINYGTGTPPDDTDPAVVRAAVLADMRNHPRNIAQSYDLPLADIQAIVAGTQPYPDGLLPAPKAQAQPKVAAPSP